MNMFRTGQIWIVIICLAIILAALGHVAYRSCTLAKRSASPDRYLVCMVRVP